jgi:N-carbamoyl-L-amino-acid hydrolase
MTVEAFVSRERLWERHMALARHGATSRNGVNRQAASQEEIAARGELLQWAAALDLRPFTDAAGNFFLRLEGTDGGSPPILSGSHLDSQPTGGKFDGAYGVLAALEALQAIRESGHQPRRAIELVAWMNEEGSRFAPGMMGSAAFSGAAALAPMLTVRDAAGVSVEQALADMKAAFPSLPERGLNRPVAAYVEAHIEQGPVLEQEGYSVGVVTGIQGKRTYRVTVRGEEAHAGTTRRRERKDALLTATAIIQALANGLHDETDVVRFTVGRLNVRPNAPSVVAAEAVFSIDLRHPDEAILRRLGDVVPAICTQHGDRCEVVVEELVTAWPLEFPRAMRTAIAAAAERVGIETMELPSAAGHDARYLHEICPTGMIFVPCQGISHNEAESAKAEDLYDGARVLAEALVALAGGGERA